MSKTVSYTEERTRIETIEYGDVTNDFLVKAFGNELVYNVLREYADNAEDTTDLKVNVNTPPNPYEFHLVRVWFNGRLVLDSKHSKYASSDMFCYLSQLQSELGIDEDSDEEPTDDNLKQNEA